MTYSRGGDIYYFTKLLFYLFFLCITIQHGLPCLLAISHLLKWPWFCSNEHIAPPPQVNPDRFNGHPFGSWLPIVSDTNHLVTLRPLKILLFPSSSSSSLTYLERSILIMIWLFYIFHIKVIFLYVKMKYITWKATYNFPMCYIIYPLCWTLLKFAFH